MIEVICGCAKPRRVAESAKGDAVYCGKCDRTIRLACAEELEDGNGAGDFDAVLTVTEGPQGVGEQIQLGGVMELVLGKSPDRHIQLIGPRVSRAHAKLVRVDFGPSKWKLVDNRSTNGLFVNGQRIAEHELQDGDVIHLGDYVLTYGHVAPPPPPLPAAGGGTCPACAKAVSKKAKICVDCGIDILTGRPILTKQGINENYLHAYAETWIWWISLLVWVTPFPIPIRSEAFGTRKPYAIWTIAVATVLASVTFFIAERANEDSPKQAAAIADYMLWAPRPAGGGHLTLAPADVKRLAADLDEHDEMVLRFKYEKQNEHLTTEQLVERYGNELLAAQEATRGSFHWYQLITHAFLHDTSSVYNFLMHLGGNMVFMLCFGTRVNALIGNVMTAILYPLLAVAAASIHLATLGHGPSGPMVGASGAIMGLAGMYLILFPVHRVFCAMWFSIWFRFKRLYVLRIFALRGFWILLIYFGYDIVTNFVLSRYGGRDGVAHWAHIGGFSTGMAVGLIVLLSRLFDTHGGDVLSVTLGRHAWKLIGKPGQRGWRNADMAAGMVPAAAG